MKPKLFLIAAALLLVIPALPTPAQAQHRKEAIILEGKPNPNNDPDSESFDQKNIEANASQMQAALESHGYTVHVANSWTVGKGSFTSVIEDLSKGPHPLTSSDEVIIYVTGHGKQSELTGECVPDAVDKEDLTDRDGHAVDPKNRPPNRYYGYMQIDGTGPDRGGTPTITTTMLKKEIKRLPDKHTGVVIDTCYAGMNIVPLSQIPGVETIYTSSRADECAYFGAVGTTIPIQMSDGTQIQTPRTGENTEGSAFSYPFIQGLNNAPQNASVADLLKAGDDNALAHDPTAVAGATDRASQPPLPPSPSDRQKQDHKYKTHPQSYNRPDPQVALTNAKNARDAAQANFEIAGNNAQGTASAVQSASNALDAAKAANPNGGQAVDDAQRALDKAIADDAKAAGNERAAKDVLDAKKKDLDKAQDFFNQVSYNAPSSNDDAQLASACPNTSVPVSFAATSSDNSEVATTAPSAPPELPDYQQPPAPGPGYLWTPGYWGYVPGDFFWVPGTWVLAPAPGLLWTPGYWGFGGGVFLWHAGYWGPHVGFYGGVDYGFGYGGVGFVGGVWDHDVYRYNTTVTNVDTTTIHDTYAGQTTTTTDPTARHASYNGGNGTTAQPTSVELAAAKEPHIPSTSEQITQAHFASTNRSLLASENGGHPSIAATTKAGEFNGKGVVAAQGSGVVASKVESDNSTSLKDQTPTQTATHPSNVTKDASKAKKPAKPSNPPKAQTWSKPRQGKHGW